ncbi:MAG TPA: hypothetical protein PLR99_32690, partial [Polyangiaceae bacterium]|nr:hypothetical protein [Polyangiaceae bacterium]
MGGGGGAPASAASTAPGPASEGAPASREGSGAPLSAGGAHELFVRDLDARRVLDRHPHHVGGGERVVAFFEAGREV